MGVQNATGIGPGGMDRAVDAEPCRIGRPRTLANNISIKVNTNKVGCPHFVVTQPAGIDQKLIARARQPRRDVAINQFRPAHMINNAVARGKLDPQSPFVSVHAGGAINERVLGRSNLWVELRGAHEAAHPPSTRMLSPWTEFDSFDAKNTAAPVSSFGSIWPIPVGVLDACILS